jgi:hypothetical protein
MNIGPMRKALDAIYHEALKMLELDLPEEL